MNEKIYKTMNGVGITNITVGIIILVTCISAGIVLIVQGTRLLKCKNNVMF